MDDLYRDYILDHYKRPRNFGELDPHDLEALEHNPLCGDELAECVSRRKTTVSRTCASTATAVRFPKRRLRSLQEGAQGDGAHRRGRAEC